MCTDQRNNVLITENCRLRRPHPRISARPVNYRTTCTMKVKRHTVADHDNLEAKVSHILIDEYDTAHD